MRSARVPTHTHTALLGLRSGAAQRSADTPPLRSFAFSATFQLEGWKRRRYWTWSVRDGAGGLLARLSSLSAADGEAWVAALRAGAGARAPPRAASDGLFGAEPPRPPLATLAARPLMRTQSANSDASTPPPKPQQQQQHARTHATPPQAAFSGLRGSTPVHREPKFSPLSSERLLYSSHAGLVNLVMIILVVNHCRLILENLTRYGVRVRAGFWVTALGLRDTPRAVPMVACFLCLAVFPLLANVIERLAFAAAARSARASGRASGSHAADRAAGVAAAVNACAALGVPIAVIHVTNAAPLPGFILLSAALVLWMKLVSYAHANADLRAQWRAQGAAKKNGARARLRACVRARARFCICGFAHPFLTQRTPARRRCALARRRRRLPFPLRRRIGATRIGIGTSGRARLR